MVSESTPNKNTIDHVLNKIKSEFDDLESFLQVNNEKTERFKSYLKSIYDHLKTQENDDQDGSLTGQHESQLLVPHELIIDKQLVDSEQIYQQLQLFTNTKSDTNINSFTKFFSKCLVQLDDISFGLEDEKNGVESSSSNSFVSNEGSEDAEDEQDSDDDVEDDGQDLEDDDIEGDEELVNFDDDDEGDIEDLAPVDDDDDDDEEGDENESSADELEGLGKSKNKPLNPDDIDSDEVDEDLVDLYDNEDLGDERELLELDKPSKPFASVDFDRDDFGLLDDKKRDLFEDGSDDEDAKNDGNKSDQVKSSFELRQEKLNQKIEEMHDSMLKNLADKPWQVKGEVTAKTRPQDSLLEEYLEFDSVTRQAPVLDASITEQLEKIIKQRIKDKAFDDVERKVKPVDMQYQYRKEVILDQEKSKLGLGEVYEQEFMKQQEKEQGKEAEASSANGELKNPKHEEIRKRMQSLFMKLDALSNFHFTPKAPEPELKVVSNMPSIAMEEVAPVGVADSSLLAPEEIKRKIQALPKSKSEEDKKDKKRNLRGKKLIAKKKKVRQEKKLLLAQSLNPDNAKVNKEIAMNKLQKQAKNKSSNITILKKDKNDKADKSSYRSSSAFFKKLQESTQVKAVKKRPKKTDSISSKKLKL